MESHQWQKPSSVKVAASALVVCAVLVGASYFLRDEGEAGVSTPSVPELPALQEILARCEEGPTVETVEAGVRTRCTARKHPAFMMELVSNGDQILAASVLVPTQGPAEQQMQRTAVGFQLFEAIAGVPASTFLPEDYMDFVGSRETSVVFKGRNYNTQPIEGVGLVFSALPVESAAAPSE